MKELKKQSPKFKTPTCVMLQCRLSFVHLDKPWAGSEGNEPKYSVSCIIPKSDKETVAGVKKAIDAAAKEGITTKWNGKAAVVKSSNFKYPLKDGDTERPDDEAYAGCYFFNASAKSPVPTFNRLREAVEPDYIYSGCWALVQVNFFPFDQGSKGIAAGLNMVLKVADDKKLGGPQASVSDFEGFELDDDDAGDDDDPFGDM